MKTLDVLLIADAIMPIIKPLKVEAILSMGDISTPHLLKIQKEHGMAPLLYVQGNHDELSPIEKGISLHAQNYTFYGIDFAGLSGCLRYREHDGHLYEQWEASELMEDVQGCEIFVAHSAPKGIHDEGTQEGFDCLTNYIEQFQPQYFFHAHEEKSVETKLEHTRVIGIHGYQYLKLQIK